MLPLLCALLILFAGSPPAEALPLDALLAPKPQAVLLAGESLWEVQFKGIRPRLLPNHALVQRLFEETQQALEPSLLVESLRIYRKPSVAAQGDWSVAEQGALFNEILALSTLTGLQYFSSSHKAMQTLYERSQVIDGPDTQKPLPDPVYEVLPAQVRVYARQKDLIFGDRIYQYEYYTAPSALVLVQRNLSPLSVGIIPAVGKEHLRSLVAVIDAEAYLLIYAASMAKAVSLPGLNQRVGQSFATRTDALMSWFSARADRTFTR
ncbi:MAG: hypothetical protein LBD74_02375 [Spirochaetaceae bacterium]|jgi:hypothetical protein|nr:hypothetical protein [Spirochaetaceae bacterium]